MQTVTDGLMCFRSFRLKHSCVSPSLCKHLLALLTLAVRRHIASGCGATNPVPGALVSCICAIADACGSLRSRI